MMDRRAFVQGAAAFLAAWPWVARAQSVGRVYRVGILRPGWPALTPDFQTTLFPTAMRELGYVEGRNLVVDLRYAEGDLKRLPALARDLVQAPVDVIVAVGALASRAAKEATQTLPIVMYGNFDPLALRLVDSLARPGGNATGVLIAPDGTLAGKRLELLKAAVPQASRIALLVPDDDSTRLQVQETRQAAASLGVELVVVTMHGQEYSRAFAAITAERPGALVVGSHQYFVRDRKEIIGLAAQHRLPAMYEWREQVADGGLMTYSTNLHGLYQRLASYVDRILKGVKPSELPVERPTRFEFVINMKTARALGLTIPQALLLRADDVIE